MSHRTRISLALLVFVCLTVVLFWMMKSPQGINASVALQDVFTGIVDDASLQFHTKGEGWAGEKLGGFASTHTLHTAHSKQGDASACWTMPQMAPGPYRAYATWPQDERMGTVTYAVIEGQTSLLSQGTDQSKDPVGEVWSWIPWQALGEVTVQQGREVRLCVSAAQNVKFAADAVRLMSAARPTRIGASFPSGTFLTEGGTHPDGEGGCNLRCPTPERCALVCGEQKYAPREGGVGGTYDVVRGDASTLWSFEDVLPGEYSLIFTWPGDAAQKTAPAKHLTFLVTDKGNPQEETYTLPTVKLTKAPTGSQWQGALWKELGVVHVERGKVVQVLLQPPVTPSSLQDIPAFTYPADAVALVPKAPLPVFPPTGSMVADDGTPVFTLREPRYWESRKGGYGVGHKVLSAVRPNGTDAMRVGSEVKADATWTLRRVRPGIYDFFATWPAEKDVQPHGDYRVQEEGSLPFMFPSVNHSVEPHGALRGGSERWQRLGTVEILKKNDVRVLLNGGVADAVALVPRGTADIPAPSPPTTADIGLTLTNITRAITAPGSTASYILTLRNTGPEEARRVSMSLPLPPGLTLRKDGTDPSCTMIDTDVTCTSDDRTTGFTLKKGEAKMFALVFDVMKNRACGTPILLRATALERHSQDPVTANDWAEAHTPVECLALQTSLKRGEQDPVSPGSIVSYVATMRNESAFREAHTVAIVFSPPAGFILALQEENVQGCHLQESRILCNLGTLTPGATREVRAAFSVPSSITCSSAVAMDVDVHTTDAAAPTRQSIQEQVWCPTADLAVSLTGSSSVLQGRTLSYALTVMNRGPQTAKNIQAHFLLPTELSFSPAQSDAGCTQEKQIVTCNGGSTQGFSLAPGEARTLQLTVKAAATALCGKTLQSVGDAQSTTQDPQPENNRHTYNVRVQCKGVDLQLTSIPVVATHPGERFSIAYRITNAGPESAEQVNLRSSIPSDASFDVAHSTAGCRQVGTNVFCTGDTLEGFGLRQGENREFTITYQSSSSLACDTSIRVESEVLSRSTETHAQDNVASLFIPVGCQLRAQEDAADVSVQLLSPDPSPGPGVTSLFVLTARNTGPGTAQDVFFALTIPEGFRLNAPTAPPECKQTAATQITCGAGGSAGLELGAGQAARIAIPVLAPPRAKLPCGTPVNVAASIRTSSKDTNPLNNSTQGAFAAFCPFDPFTSN